MILEKFARQFENELNAMLSKPEEFSFDRVRTDGFLTSIAIQYRKTPFIFTIYRGNSDNQHMFYAKFVGFFPPDIKEKQIAADISSDNIKGRIATWIREHINIFLEEVGDEQVEFAKPATKREATKSTSSLPMTNEKPLFDRILQTLFDLQESGEYHNLFALLPDADKQLLRDKVKELQVRKLVHVKSEFHTPTFYGTEVINPVPPESESQRRAKQLRYENELNVRIEFEGISYVNGLRHASSQFVTSVLHDQSTHQVISGSTIHGAVNQSSDSSQSVSINAGKTSKKKMLTRLSIIIGIMASLATVIMFIKWAMDYFQ